MTLWLDGMKPPVMDSEENKVLTHDDVTRAVNSMTYEGLQICAAGYLLMMQGCGWSPRQISESVEKILMTGGTGAEEDARIRKAKRIRRCLRRYGQDEHLGRFYENALRAVTGKNGGDAA